MPRLFVTTLVLAAGLTVASCSETPTRSDSAGADSAAKEAAEKQAAEVRDPDAVRELESLRLARIEMERQLENTTHDRRAAQLKQAMAELDKRVAALRKKV